MDYLRAFLFVGLICAIGQVILDNTNFTPGHVTSIFVVIGSFLGFLGIYDKFKSFAGVGASIPISSFGNLLYTAAYEGYLKTGLLGIFSNLLVSTSAGITAAIVFSFFFSLIFKPKD